MGLEQEIEIDLGDTVKSPTSYCEDCNAPLYDRRRKKCESCRSVAPVAKTVKSRFVAKGKPDDVKTTAAISKLLIIVTLLIMYMRVKSLGIPDSQGSLAEELAFNDEEAIAIAKPIARWSSSSAVGSRVVAPLVNNQDLIECAFALYEWNRRTDDILRQMTNGELSANRPRRVKDNGNTGPIQADRPSDIEYIGGGHSWDYVTAAG